MNEVTVAISPIEFEPLYEKTSSSASTIKITDVRISCSVQFLDEKGNVVESRRVLADAPKLYDDQAIIDAILTNSGTEAKRQ